MTYSFSIRLIVVIVAIFTAIAVVIFILKPSIFESWCLVGTNSSLEIEYWTLQNSVLAHAVPTGYWIWYNGRYIYVFGQQTGQTCPKPDKYEPAYVIDTNENKILGYECVMHLNDIIAYYQQNGSDKKYLFKKISKDQWNTFNIYDMMNFLVESNVVYITN